MRQIQWPFFWLILLFLIPHPAAAQPDEPKLVVDHPDYNFSRVFTGEQVIHTFEFRNAGAAPLVINKVRHSCGCTASLLSSKLLKPGQAGEIQSTFDTTRFNGPVVKTIYIYSNDPVRSVVQLQMRGVIKKEITQHPRRVSLGNLVPRTTTRAEVVLVNRGKNHIYLEEPQVTTPELVASLSSRSLSPDQKLTLTILVTPKPDNRRLGGYVVIPLSGAHLNEVRIPIYAEVIQAPQS